MRRMLTLVLTMLVAALAVAGTVSRDDAEALARAFFESRGKTLQSASTAARRAPSVGDDIVMRRFHAFNAADGQGYVILSADDRTPSVLAYADTGSFDRDAMPDNMRSWLCHYADEMRWLDDQGRQIADNAAPARAPQVPRHTIAPLLDCMWNQGEPYNAMCPIYYNEDGIMGGRCATGCIATAIAQVLYHYRYPAAVKRRIPAMTSNSQTLSAISAGTAIDWDHMRPTYDDSSTQQECDAVAKLMLIVGQSLKMGYGPSSGSSYADARRLLVDHLGYDDGVQVLRSDNYAIGEWLDMIYGELEKGYPVAYGGSSTGGGHAFVIDGYDGADMFHVNWGWGGASNGYFRLSVLAPGDNAGMGASSSADGYSMAQDAILYLRAEDDGIPYNPETGKHLSINDTRVDATSIFSNYINWTGALGSFQTAIVEKDADGQWTPVTDVRTITLDVNTYVGQTFDLTGRLSPGTHSLTPASKLAAEQTWTPLYDFKVEYVEAVADENGAVTLTKVDMPIGLEVEHWAFPGTLKAGDRQTVNISMRNNGAEFKREVALYASKTADMGASVSRALIGVEEGGSDEFAFFFTPQTTGTYNLWLTLNSDSRKVIARTTVDVAATAKRQASLEVGQVSVEGGAYGNFLRGTMTVKNNATADFDGIVEMQCWKEGSGGYWHSGNSVKLHYTIAAGQSGTADFLFPNLEIGGNYRFNQRYTTQDGELSKGGVFDGDQWTLKSGIIAWTKNGTISGTAATTVYKPTNTTAGVWFCGTVPQSVTPSTNPNTIYAFDEGATLPSGLDGCNVAVGGVADELHLTYGSPAYFPTAVTAKKAVFAVPITTVGDGKKGWMAVTLPFVPQTITIDSSPATWTRPGVEGQFRIKRFAEVDDNGWVWFDDAVSLRQSTPYLMSFPESLAGSTLVMTADNVTFVPTVDSRMEEYTRDYRFFATTYSPRLSGAYEMNADGTAFETGNASRTGVKSFGAYFTTSLDPAPERIEVRIADGTDGIAETSAATAADSRVYDLQGRQVSSIESKGIYIVGGRKVVR